MSLSRKKKEMIDPISFAAGGAVVVVCKIAYDAASATISQKMVEPNSVPPPPPPMPKSAVKIKIFVDNLVSILDQSDRSCAFAKIQDGGAASPTHDRPKMRTPKLLKLVSQEDLCSVKLKPTVTKEINTMCRQEVNASPLCFHCLKQKEKLAHI